MSVVNQKRIAKNTALLYVRMLLIMAISLYTSRVVIDALGKVDYGLYNVVGTIVVSFSFLNGIMSSACSRYFAIEIGRGDDEALRKVFSLNITIFILLSVIILVFSETIGLWFLNNKMKIPDDRLEAANWVYQFSIISFLFNMMVVPFRSIIIARENMRVFAYCSIVEVILKLLIVYLLLVLPYDRLIMYGWLMLLVTVIVGGFYMQYCVRCYRECRYRYYWSTSLFREIVGYTGWNLIGNLATVGKSQGVNILLNMFYGPIMNTARGIAYQVFVNINQFVSNFTTAFNPQIIKSYSANARSEMLKLVYQSSKFSYFLLYFLVLPVILETPYILELWLKKGNVVDHTVSFTRLMLVTALIDSLSYPLMTAVMATGQVKKYQLTVGMTMLATLPISYIVFKYWDVPPESIFYILLIASVIGQCFRIKIMNSLHQMRYSEYIRLVILPVVVVTVLPLILSSAIICYMDASFLRLCVTLIVCTITTASTVMFGGLTSSERIRVVQTVKNKLIRRP